MNDNQKKICDILGFSYAENLHQWVLTREGTANKYVSTVFADDAPYTIDDMFNWIRSKKSLIGNTGFSATYDSYNLLLINAYKDYKIKTTADTILETFEKHVLAIDLKLNPPAVAPGAPVNGQPGITPTTVTTAAGFEEIKAAIKAKIIASLQTA